MKIFQEVVEGVCYIHSMGVMHRDIKVSSSNYYLRLKKTKTIYIVGELKQLHSCIRDDLGS